MNTRSLFEKPQIHISYGSPGRITGVVEHNVTLLSMAFREGDFDVLGTHRCTGAAAIGLL